jgi:hypothetical protein
MALRCDSYFRLSASFSAYNLLKTVNRSPTYPTAKLWLGLCQEEIVMQDSEVHRSEIDELLSARLKSNTPRPATGKSVLVVGNHFSNNRLLKHLVELQGCTRQAVQQHLPQATAVTIEIGQRGCAWHQIYRHVTLCGLRHRIASCPASGTHTAVSSPARCNRARLAASRPCEHQARHT